MIHVHTVCCRWPLFESLAILFRAVPYKVLPCWQSVCFQEMVSPLTCMQKTRYRPGSSRTVSCLSADVQRVSSVQVIIRSPGGVFRFLKQKQFEYCLFSVTGWHLILSWVQFTVWLKVEWTSLHWFWTTVKFVCNRNFANYGTQTTDTVHYMQNRHLVLSVLSNFLILKRLKTIWSSLSFLKGKIIWDHFSLSLSVHFIY